VFGQTDVSEMSLANGVRILSQHLLPHPLQLQTGKTQDRSMRL
jgi:hypothetical protein